MQPPDALKGWVPVIALALSIAGGGWGVYTQMDKAIQTATNTANAAISTAGALRGEIDRLAGTLEAVNKTLQDTQALNFSITRLDERLNELGMRVRENHDQILENETALRSYDQNVAERVATVERHLAELRVLLRAAVSGAGDEGAEPGAGPFTRPVAPASPGLGAERPAPMVNP